VKTRFDDELPEHKRRDLVQSRIAAPGREEFLRKNVREFIGIEKVRPRLGAIR
jgi:hypothetical protein